jgi:hypothetical protein
MFTFMYLSCPVVHGILFIDGYWWKICQIYIIDKWFHRIEDYEQGLEINVNSSGKFGLLCANSWLNIFIKTAAIHILSTCIQLCHQNMLKIMFYLQWKCDTNHNQLCVFRQCSAIIQTLGPKLKYCWFPLDLPTQ